MALNDEIDRKDLGLTIDTCDETTQRSARQQIPAFACRENADGLTCFVYRCAHLPYATTALGGLRAPFGPKDEDFRPCPRVNAKAHREVWST